MAKKISLKEQKKILKENIENEERMIDNNESYTSPDGKTFGPEHYKQAVEHDKEDLKAVNDKLAEKKKIRELRDRAISISKGIEEDKKKSKLK